MEQEVICSICHEITKEKESISLFNCGHTFCIKCISHWVISRKKSIEHTCPNCRTEITEVDIWFCMHYESVKLISQVG